MTEFHPRITKISISNYRSIGRDQCIGLGRMTVLVGPNGSGKSNVVDVLGFVRDAMQMGLSGAIADRGGIGAVRRWSSGHPHNVSIKLNVALESGPGSYSFEIAGDRKEKFRVRSEEAVVFTDQGSVRFTVERGKWNGPEGLEPKVSGTSLALPTIAGDERFRHLFELLVCPVIYSIYPDTLRQPRSTVLTGRCTGMATIGSLFYEIRNSQRGNRRSWRGLSGSLGISRMSR